MTRFQDNRQKIMRVESKMCPKVLKRLHGEKITNSKWLACWAGHTQFKVKSGLQSFTMDMEKKNIVVVGNSIRLAYHVPMQFPAYSLISKKLSSMCIGVFMFPHIRPVMS